MLNASRPTWPCASPITAVKSISSECIGSIEAWRLAMCRNREHQRAIKHLLTLDDRLLDDVGLSRSDLIARIGRRATDRQQERKTQC